MKLFAGVALPLGDFASTTGATAGYAKTGFCLGIDLATEVARSFEIGFIGSFNSLSFDAAAAEAQFRQAFGTNNITINADSWFVVGGFGAVGFAAEASPVVRIYGKGLVGLLYGHAPEIRGTANGTPFSQNSASASAIGYGFAFGATVNNQVDLGVRFFTGEPEYSTTAQGGGISSSGKFKQPSSVVQLTIGYVFSLN